MIRTYENFTELANAMTKGDGILHSYNCPYKKENAPNDDCLSWQKGVQDFAGWLDHIGAKIEMPDKADDFYEYMRNK